MLHKIDALICLGAGSSQFPIIKSAKQIGLNVIAIDRDLDAIGFGIADEKIIISTYNTDEILEELFKFQNLYNFKGLVAGVSGPALHTAAEISETFNLPGLTHDLIPLATEKSSLRTFCEKNNFKVPKGYKLSKNQPCESDLYFPIIVKPDYPLIGKKDISVVQSSEDLSGFINKACDSSSNNFAEIEEYIHGIDVSVMFLLSKGRAKIITLWDELVGIDLNLQIKGLGVGVPSVIDNFDLKLKVEEFIIKFSAKLNKKVHSLLIASLRITPHGDIYIIELHADLGGDLIADVLLPFSNKEFDFFKLVVEYSLNIKKEQKNFKFSPTIMMYSNSKYLKNLEHKEKEYFFIKNPSVISNLTVANSYFDLLDLNNKPFHFEWITNKN